MDDSKLASDSLWVWGSGPRFRYHVVVQRVQKPHPNGNTYWVNISPCRIKYSASHPWRLDALRIDYDHSLCRNCLRALKSGRVTAMRATDVEPSEVRTR